MDTIFMRLMATRFSDLAGLTVDASVPVPEHLINELIQSALRGQKNNSSLHVTVHPANRVSIDLRTPMWPWPLHLKLKLFGAVDLSPSPKVRAFLENNRLLAKLDMLFKGLPPRITFYKDQVAVDLDPFLPPEYKKFLPLVKSLDVRTEESKLILDVKIRR